MPVPVLKIPVDRSEFDAYLAAFRKYQEQLEVQPEVWKGVNDGISAASVAVGALVVEIIEQASRTKELTEEEKKAEEAKKKADEEEKNRGEDRKKRDEEEKKRRRDAITQVKQYGKDLAEAAVQMGKWALIGEGAGVAAGALSFWGLDQMVKGVGEERRTAQGYGVSMGMHQGMGLNMQRYFDVNSVLETAANAQATPGDWGVFRMMGVDPRGKDPAALAGEMALAARRLFKRDGGNLALADAQGLTRVFSPDDLRRLAATPEGSLRQSIADSRKVAANSGLSDEVGRKWQQFIINLDTAGLALKNKLIDKLSILEPDLEILMKKFTDLAVTVMDRIDFKLLGQGLDAFTRTISSGEFQHGFMTFVDNVGAVGEKLGDLLRLMGIIPASSGSPPPLGVPSAEASPPPSGGPSLALGGGGFLGTGAYGMIAQSWADRQLQKWGWTPDQAKGIEANISAESGFSPLLWERGMSHSDPKAGYGLGQWNKDRRDIFAKVFGHEMTSVSDPKQAIREQLEFYQWELTSPSKLNHLKRSGDKLRGAHSAFEAGYDVSLYHERPKGGRLTALARGLKAATTVNLKITNQTGASVATTVNSAAGG